MIQSLQLTSVPIPEDVRTFAEEQGVSAELPRVLEMTRRLFPRATLTVELEDDPEIPHDKHIVINAEGVDMPVSAGMQAREQLLAGLLACCPAPRVCVFRVTMRGLR